MDASTGLFLSSSFFLDKPRKLSKFVSVLLSASVERVGVSRMWDFFWHVIYLFVWLVVLQVAWMISALGVKQLFGWLVFWLIGCWL